MVDKSNEKLNIDNYDYVAYVDASGDDGFKFNGKSAGSSTCYAVAMFVVKKEDILFNHNKLLEIKKIIGCKPEHEVKYTTLRRHRNSKQAHELVSEMKGTIVSWVAYKQAIDNPYILDVKNKALSQFCHIFPINAIPEVLRNEDDNNKNIFIAVDVMKKVEMDGLAELIKRDDTFGFNSIGKKVFNNYKLKFKDSKDKDFQLIQVADIFAGIIRNSFENLDMSHPIWKTCKICFFTKRKKKISLCKYKRKKVPLEGTYNLYKIMPLFLKSSDYNGVIMNGITPFPLELYKNIRFIDCLLNKEYNLI